MALTDENLGTTMLVQPSYGGMPYGGNFGGGLLGGNNDLLGLLFVIALCNGGWGGGFGFGGGWGMGMMGMGMMGMDYLYPWLNNSQHISDGFRDQQLNAQISDARTDINRGFGDVQLGIAGINQNICQTGNGITAAVNNGFSQAEIAANGRQMANMQQAFAAQQAMSQGFYDLASKQADCCCENRLATCQTQNIVQNEGNATRFADANNTRDIIESQTRGTQAILDKLCALELDGVKAQLAQAQRENVGLQNAVNMAAFRESQANQNALFAQGLTNEVDQLYNRLKNCPVGTVPVAGNTPLFSCNPSFNGNNSGCGCGCGAF